MNPFCKHLNYAGLGISIYLPLTELGREQRTRWEIFIGVSCSS